MAKVSCKILLTLAAALGLTVSAVDTAELPMEQVERYNGGLQPISPTFYSLMMNGAEHNICIVARPGNAVLLQPSTRPRLDGSFSIQGLDSSLYIVRHIVQACHSTQSEQCDTLWIDGKISPMERGFFYVLYTPPRSGEPTLIRVSYGPEGITFAGGSSSNPLVEIPPFPEGVTFELRTPERLDAVHANVCESIGSGVYQQSRLLEARSSTAFLGCSRAISERGSSVPYIITVTLHHTASIRSLTTREIVITFSPCNHIAGLTSQPLQITGADTTELTTSPAGPGNDIATTPPTDATNGTPPASTSSRVSPTSTFSSQPTNNGHIAATLAIYIIVVVVAVAALVLIAVAAVWCIWKRKKHLKKRTVKVGGVENPMNSQGMVDPADPAQPASCIDGKTTRSPSTDSTRTESTRTSFESERVVMSSAVPLPEHTAVGETLQQIKVYAGEIAQGVKNLNTNKEGINKQLLHIERDAKELKSGQEYLLDRVETQNLSSS